MVKTFQALEEKSEIKTALKDLEHHFCVGAKKKAGMDGNIYWHEKYSCWGCLGKPSFPTRYWIPFGIINKNHRQNMIVEINPATSGINTNVQGLIARDGNGNRWLMHQGRLHPRDVRISQDMFDQFYIKERTDVSFSNGKTVGYHKVACLDGDGIRLIRNLSKFVHACDEIRTYWADISSGSHLETVLKNSERRFNQEVHGSSFRAGTKGRVFKRNHGKVVNELAEYLEAKGYEVDNRYNKRRLGPDLMAFRPDYPSLLFEIKTRLDMTHLYCALGQVFVYEELADHDFQRVVVFPATLDQQLEEVLVSLDVELLRYSLNDSGNIQFDLSLLKKLMIKQK